MKPRLVVIGGGAAGFFCAVNAARMNPSLSVTIVEKSSKLLSKVRVSGGGRCNVTHACYETSALVKKYPRGTNFLKKAFNHFGAKQCLEWFANRGVILKTEADGRMFPESNNSQTIIDCLLKEANIYGINIMMNREVKRIQEPQNTELQKGFSMKFSTGETIESEYVVVACGGYPKSSMFSWLVNLGHHIEDPVPSLFTFNMPGNSITELMGVSVENAAVKVIGTKLADEGPLLITHWGMSGPAILKLSAWGARELANRQYEYTIIVNWIPNYNEAQLRDDWSTIRQQLSAQKISNRNPFGLPSRLWVYLLNQSQVKEDIRWADLPGKEQNKLIKNLVSQEFNVKGKTTFKEEFVTCGGIRLTEVDPNTLQSRVVPNLFFAGEILDVDGVTGGFNFQHAWTSGWIAAQAIAGNQ